MLRILCVDDEPAIRMVLGALLQRHGHQVETADNGLEAWKLLADDPNAYELVVTDNDMPHVTGMGLIERLRSHGYVGQILLFSGSIAAAARHKLAALNVYAVVPKGEPNELMNCVHRIAVA